MWQSGIDDGGIQDTDERTKDGRDQHPPCIAAACTHCGWTCDPSSRHMKMGTHALFLSFFRSAPPIVYDPILRKWVGTAREANCLLEIPALLVPDSRRPLPTLSITTASWATSLRGTCASPASRCVFWTTSRSATALSASLARS